MVDTSKESASGAHWAYPGRQAVRKFVNFLLLFNNAGAQHGVDGSMLAQHAALRAGLAHRGLGTILLQWMNDLF